MYVVRAINRATGEGQTINIIKRSLFKKICNNNDFMYCLYKNDVLLDIINSD